jgi:hypothetical protein
MNPGVNKVVVTVKGQRAEPAELSATHAFHPRREAPVPTVRRKKAKSAGAKELAAYLGWKRGVDRLVALGAHNWSKADFGLSSALEATGLAFTYRKYSLAGQAFSRKIKRMRTAALHQFGVQRRGTGAQDDGRDTSINTYSPPGASGSYATPRKRRR